MSLRLQLVGPVTKLRPRPNEAIREFADRLYQMQSEYFRAMTGSPYREFDDLAPKVRKMWFAQARRLKAR